MAPNKIVVVSGYYDPLHLGHLRMFEMAKQLGDKLVVIVNNDMQAALKKGKSFMPEEDRCELVKALKVVDDVFLSVDTDKTVCKSLEVLRPNVFANGGDRKDMNDIPEAETCQRLGIEMVFNVGTKKIRSSSEYIKKFYENAEH